AFRDTLKSWLFGYLTTWLALRPFPNLLSKVKFECARIEQVLRYHHMKHCICRVTAFDIVAPYILRGHFDNDTAQTIDFQAVLAGELYRPLRDLSLFNEVRIDPEVHTLVWPNGADFDPATLHDWPQYVDDLAERRKRWDLVGAQK